MRQSGICAALIGATLFLAGVGRAEDEQETDVPYPDLPKGAGKIDENAPKSFKSTDSGLKYRVLREGTGKKPTPATLVAAHYQGWLDNGKVFDSSYRRRQPITFKLEQVVKGWGEGMQLVGQGGMIELEIPPELGYGNRGRPGIPANSTLHFIVEVLDVR